jgi:hypothetical protein
MNSQVLNMPKSVIRLQYNSFIYSEASYDEAIDNMAKYIMQTLEKCESNTLVKTKDNLNAGKAKQIILDCYVMTPEDLKQIINEAKS